jgi:hypothetical protein
LSFTLSRKVRELPKGACSRAERQMLKELADLADDAGRRLFPSHRYLATRLSWSVRWVELGLAKLRARRWLHVERAGGGTYEGGRGRRNLYRLALPDTQAQLALTFPQANALVSGDIASFPHDPQALFNNPDQTIGVLPRSNDHPYPDQTIGVPVALTPDAPTDCPVKIDPIPPVRTQEVQIDPPVGTRARAEHTLDDDPTFQDALKRMRMLKVELATTPAPARRRRHRR